MAKLPTPEELSKIDYAPPKTGWMDTPVVLKEGMFCHGSKPKSLQTLSFPNPRDWRPMDEDWKLPENWKQIILEGIADRLEKYRSFRLFMDICVRCGACADKCHFYIGSGDPKNMPVLRAELMRSVYRRYFTTAGRLFPTLAGARDLTEDVLKEWFYYFYQCTECRRCSVFCPYGIDTAEVTMIGRELLTLVGCNINWVLQPVANSYRTGNHLGVQPHGFKDSMEFAADELAEITGIRVEVPINKKGAEILFLVPSADYFGTPHYYTLLGTLMVLHEIGLEYTFSAFASEGGDFGLFTSHEMVKRINAKIYEEARRLGVKWILGGECGHMWRVCNQYMSTWWGPVDFLEKPVSPITGTKFENAEVHKMVHISEFTADLIHHGKLNLDPQRNAHIKMTFHDSCNTARGMGILEEPRYIINNVLPEGNFVEMPPNTIREKAFCCGSSSGINANENMELRMQGGFPRANAVRFVHEKYGVNHLGCICALDRATLPTLLQYWVPEVEVTGITELVGNALIFPDELERTTDLRDRDLMGFGELAEEAGEEEE